MCVRVRVRVCVFRKQKTHIEWERNVCFCGQRDFFLKKACLLETACPRESDCTTILEKVSIMKKSFVFESVYVEETVCVRQCLEPSVLETAYVSL